MCPDSSPSRLNSTSQRYVARRATATPRPAQSFVSFSRAHAMPHVPQHVSHHTCHTTSIKHVVSLFYIGWPFGFDSVVASYCLVACFCRFVFDRGGRNVWQDSKDRRESLVAALSLVVDALTHCR